MKGRVIITVLGSDKSGIVAGVSKKLSELKGNILDITQTIFDGDLFAMIMLVDCKETNMEFVTFKDALKVIDRCCLYLAYRLHLSIVRENINFH